MKKPRNPRRRRPAGRATEPDPDRISILDRQRGLAVDRGRLEAAVELVLAGLGLRDAEVTVTLLSDNGIRSLNRRYLERNRPTDVLAFSQREGPLPGSDERVLGDVVVSAETAARQARERGIPFNEELDRLVVHGILHLIGYDHTDRPSEALRMGREQSRILRRLHHRLPP